MSLCLFSFQPVLVNLRPKEREPICSSEQKELSYIDFPIAW